MADNREGFQHALAERGFFLSTGDRRAHVILDYQGEVYALSRALNLKAKDIRARLGDDAVLPSAEETRKIISERMTPALHPHRALGYRSPHQFIAEKRSTQEAGLSDL